MPKIKSDKGSYHVESLERGLEVLETLARARRPMKLTEIGSVLDMNYTSATRMCATLCTLGYLRKDSQKHYHLTPRILTLGFAVLQGMSWREVAEMRLKKLHDHIGETVNLGIMEGDEILYIVRLRQDKYLHFDLQVGSLLPLHCTSLGKAMLAFGRPGIVNPILRALEFKPLGPKTITDAQAFEADLSRIRKRGYALNDEELTPGVLSVACPIFDQAGEALMAVNITVPKKRFSLSEVEKQFVPLLKTATRELSNTFAGMQLTQEDIWQSY
ncbi:MAG: IclR family transcriptional regulator [Desulfobacterales bacterium]|nr:IclR family transcriptional regulator [Desulfobacterales bacterium]